MFWSAFPPLVNCPFAISTSTSNRKLKLAEPKLNSWSTPQTCHLPLFSPPTSGNFVYLGAGKKKKLDSFLSAQLTSKPPANPFSFTFRIDPESLHSSPPPLLPGPGQHHLSPGCLQQPPRWAFCFCSCPWLSSPAVAIATQDASCNSPQGSRLTQRKCQHLIMGSRSWSSTMLPLPLPLQPHWSPAFPPRAFGPVFPTTDYSLPPPPITACLIPLLPVVSAHIPHHQSRFPWPSWINKSPSGLLTVCVTNQ